MVVRCGECGNRYELSARNARAARKAGREPRCRRCRGIRDAPAVTDEHRRYWLDRFTLDEIRELADGLFVSTLRS